MNHAIRVHEYGGPEVLSWEEVPDPSPGPGEVTVRHTVVGLNYIDVYHRTGAYPRDLPLTLGVEAAGEVEAVGEGVVNFAPGDRVAYVLQLGSYSEARAVPADRLVKIPDDISDEIAAASLLKGLTAHFLLHRTKRVGPDDRILVHAAAGGVGLLLSQWAKYLGAEVVGVVSSEEKAKLASEAGCDEVVVSDGGDFEFAVRKLYGEQGMSVVYDSVGQATFSSSLKSLRDFGLLVLFGQSSGVVPPIDPNILQNGSVYLTRPTLVTHAGHPGLLREGARSLFEAISGGILDVQVRQRFELKEAARAHRALESRQTTGSSVLLV